MWPFKSKRDIEQQRIIQLTNRVVEEARVRVQNEEIDAINDLISRWRVSNKLKEEEDLILRIQNEVSLKVCGEDFIDQIISRINRKQLT